MICPPRSTNVLLVALSPTDYPGPLPKQHYSLICVEQSFVNRFKVIEHPLPSFIRVSTKVVLTIKGMEKPIALVEGFSQHVF